MTVAVNAIARHKYRAQAKAGEAYAIKHDPRAPNPQADLLDLMFEPIIPNEECDGYCVVTIRGPLEHHECPFGDSYEAIAKRFREACAHDGGCIVIRIDSPGGLVSGLNEAVRDMQKMVKASGKRVIAYCDETIASAAYALSCVAHEIVLPPSGMVGSIGVISFMVDQVEADKKQGLNWITITSGARKDDGHPHTTISQEAIDAEAERVADMAQQFFGLVKRARGFDPQSLEAGLFLGKKAVTAGVADAVMGWDELLVDVANVYGSGEVLAQSDTTVSLTNQPEAEMGIKLQALIKTTEKALAATKDPKKRAVLTADLQAFKKTYKKTEESETEESDDHDEEEETAESDGDEEEASAAEDDDKGDDKDEKKEKKSKKSAKAKAEDKDDEDKEASAEDDDEEASAEDDDDKKEAVSALLAGIPKAKRAAARGALMALVADAERGRHAAAQVNRLTQETQRTKLYASIDAKLAARHVSRAEAKWLKTQPKATVESFLATRKGPIVLSEEDAPSPRGNAGSSADYRDGRYSADQMEIFKKAASTMGKPVEEFIKYYEGRPAAANGVAAGAVALPSRNGGN